MSNSTPERLHIIGVRHHSPACARLVDATIRSVQPAVVLIEGPSDLNERIHELLLGHHTPIALYSFLHAVDESGETTTRKSSWYPLCSYSPEWVALQTGNEIGSDLRFMDLPSWHDAFEDVENLTSDRRDRYSDAIDLLCDRTGMNNMDSLWDHLFEGVDDLAQLAHALDTYFDEIRTLSPLSGRDAARETHMRAHISAALSKYPTGNIVVVCGGYHAPALVVESAEEPCGEEIAFGGKHLSWPAAPAVTNGTAETYLVPYSYHRLDAFSGYQSGMPSPGYYETLHREGIESTATQMLQLVAARLRGIKQIVSTADLVAAQTLTDALARLRSHKHPLRCDVLDGLGGALLKDAREQPYPWDVRAPLSIRTHPLLTEIVAAFSGDRRGRLAGDTPLPPLVADIHEQLTLCSLTITESSREIQLDLTKPRDLFTSATLHRIQTLEIPGFNLNGNGLRIDERWSIVDDLDATAHMIEASVFGPTLEQATMAALREQLHQVEPTTAPLIDILTQAISCRLVGLDAEAIGAAQHAIGLDQSLKSVGQTMISLAELLSADELFRRNVPTDTPSGVGTDSGSFEPQLHALVGAAIERFIWLLEQLTGQSSGDDKANVEAIVSLCSAMRLVETHPSIVAGVLQRKSVDRAAPPAIRGASLGALWALNLVVDEQHATATAIAVQGFRSISPTDGPGDFLMGLFATARLLVVQDDVLVAELDGFIERLSPDEFLNLLPSLRAAFAWFTPRERSIVGEHVARLRGLTKGAGLARQMDHDPLAVAQAMAFESELLVYLRTYGLSESSVRL
jgi:hypothetical protein